MLGTISFDVRPCSLVVVATTTNIRVEAQVKRGKTWLSCRPGMEPACRLLGSHEHGSNTFVGNGIYQTTRCHIAEQRSLQYIADPGYKYK
jgi:hypothetical protein